MRAAVPEQSGDTGTGPAHQEDTMTATTALRPARLAVVALVVLALAALLVTVPLGSSTGDTWSQAGRCKQCQ